MTQFGLTTNQAKVYVAIRYLGTTTVSPVANFSSVRREDVYRILPKLNEMGLIERTLETPSRFRAVPLETVLPELLRVKREESERKLSDLETIAEDLLNKSESISTQIDEENHGLLSVLPHSISPEKSSEMVKRTEKELISFSNARRYTQFFSARPGYLEETSPRNINHRVIFAEVSDELLPIIDKISKNMFSLGNTVEIKVYNDAPEPCFYLISDRREALLDASENGDEKQLILWTDNKKIIDLLLQHFEKHWTTSDTLTFS